MVSVLTLLMFALPRGSLSPTFPFSWETIPRYTFCVNSSTTQEATTGVFNNEAAEYIAAQPIYINNPTLQRPPGSISDEESRMPLQAARLRAINPNQQQLFYYAIDLIRPHNFQNDHAVSMRPECQLHDINGDPVPRMVWDFGSDCGTEAWLNTSRSLIMHSGLDGVFLDGFQGCDPFSAGGCSRVCTSKAGCNASTLQAWNAGLRAAMWRLKKEILGENGTLICNSTPGPYFCDVKNGSNYDPFDGNCPCDGTNDERGGGNFDHMQMVNTVNAEGRGNFLLLTHTPHANDKDTMLRSIAQWLIATDEYQYLGTGFGYECAGQGWLTSDPTINASFHAPLGPPLGPPAGTDGCEVAPPCCHKNSTCSPTCTPQGPCVRTRSFGTGTRVMVNYSSGATCVRWSNGLTVSTAGRDKEDGCAPQ